MSKGGYATQEFHGMIGTKNIPPTLADGDHAQSPVQHEWMAADDTTHTPARDNIVPSYLRNMEEWPPTAPQPVLIAVRLEDF